MDEASIPSKTPYTSLIRSDAKLKSFFVHTKNEAGLNLKKLTTWTTGKLTTWTTGTAEE